MTVTLFFFLSHLSYVDARLHPESVTHHHHGRHHSGGGGGGGGGGGNSLDVVEERPCDMNECACMVLQKRARQGKKQRFFYPIT